MDTKELGAGFYPNLNEKNDYKCFKFIVNLSVEAEGVVYALSEEDAINFIYQKNWDEIEKNHIEQIEDIKYIYEFQE